MEEIIKKIFHYMSYQDREQILKWSNELSVEEMMEKTYELSCMSINNRTKPVNKINKPPDYISRIIAKKTVANEQRTYVDIGGGNGDVLSYIREHIVGNESSERDNYVCVESSVNWAEPYAYDHANIKYVFWDNQLMNVASDFAHVVLCMVSLHHMDDRTILNTLREMRRILHNGGVVLMKEHDCSGPDIKRLIETEHHLYHVRTMSVENKPLNITEYFATQVFNFKSRAEWLRLFMQAGFVLRGWKNRVLGTYPLPNPTQLFWGIFV